MFQNCVLVLAGTHVIMTEVCHDFPQYLQNFPGYSTTISFQILPNLSFTSPFTIRQCVQRDAGSVADEATK